MRPPVRLARQSLQFTISILVAGALLFGVTLGAVAVVGQHSSVGDYERLLDGQVRDRTDALRMQVMFKKQVQEWKDILLRGQDPVLLRKYSAAFHARALDVDSMALALQRRVVDTVARRGLARFGDAHHLMMTKYEQALEMFVLGAGKDPHAADLLVKGQDRPPTDLIDSVVTRLTSRVEDERAVSRSRANRLGNWLAGTLAVGALVILFFALRFSSRIIAPLRELQGAAEGITAGDLSDIRIVRIARESTGEIAALAESFGEMVASLRRVLVALDESAGSVETTALTLNEQAAELSAATGELTGAASSLADGAARQKSAASTVADTASLVSTGAVAFAAQATLGLNTTDSAATRASEGAKAAAEALGRLTLINEAVVDARPVVEALTNKTERIDEIASSVEGIASQTNLLSLNAAIESARAGEQGRGFSIIAGEMKSLADESAAAVRLIRALVAEVREASERVSSRMTVVDGSVRAGEIVIRNSSAALLNITADMNGSRTAVAGVASGAEALRRHAEVLERGTREIAATAVEHAGTSQQLRAVADDQRESAAELLLTGRRLSALAVTLRSTLDDFTRSSHTTGMRASATA